MPRNIVDEATGETIEVFTADEKKAEIDARIAEKEEFQKKKLAEFENGKKSNEAKELEREARLTELQKIAEEAKATAESERTARKSSTKTYFASQFVGNDVDLKAKLEEAYGELNIDDSTDAGMQQRYQKAANMIGLGASNRSFAAPVFGGISPTFSPSKESVSDTDHKKFLQEVNYRTPKKLADQ